MIPSADAEELVQRLLLVRGRQGAVQAAQTAPRPDVWTPLPHQRPPADDDWDLFLLMGGRGCGKTEALSAWMNDHCNGPPCMRGIRPHRVAIVAPTLGDASESCVEGPSGLRSRDPGLKVVQHRGGSFVRWKNGSQAVLLGADTPSSPDRLRANGNLCAVWMEEWAAHRHMQGVYNMARLGLRLGRHPRMIASTTPRTRPLLRRVLKDPHTRVVYATTDDNPYLSEEWRARLHATYSGTRLEQQEIFGRLLEDVEGALWDYELIEVNRRSLEELPRLVRCVVNVDPSWGTTHDECGIIVTALGADSHCYVLADLSLRATPSEWGRVAGIAYRDGVPGFMAKMDRINAERNFQGEQVRLVMKTVSDELGVPIVFKLITASLGKRLRAEPVQALYQQGRVHHVGVLQGLETQMTTWVPPETSGESEAEVRQERMISRGMADEEANAEDTPAASEWSPDRIDALVFGVTDLLLGESRIGAIEVAEGRVQLGRMADPGSLANLPPRLRRLAQQQLRRG